MRRDVECHGAAWALLLTACISTDPEPTPETFPCAAAPHPEAPTESLVLVGLAEGAGFETCPGVVIGPSVLMTAASCLFPSVGPRLFADEAPACASEAGWPREDGAFAAWIDRSHDVRDIVIYSASRDETPPLSVQAVYTSGASSRCADDIALAYVPQGLARAPAPLRLEESTEVGEGVLLAGIDGQDGLLLANEAPAVVARSTNEEGDEDLPPWALMMSGQVCSIAHGGGVFSPRTGALLGIIGWATSECSNPDGSTVALRLAPYRRFILEAADALAQQLGAEGETLEGRRLLPCSR